MLAQPARERGESAGNIAARNSTFANARSAPLSLRRYASLPSPPEGSEGGRTKRDGRIRHQFATDANSAMIDTNSDAIPERWFARFINSQIKSAGGSGASASVLAATM
jgi:hypothetical protein